MVRACANVGKPYAERPGAHPAFTRSMQIPPNGASAGRPTQEEIKGLERALNSAYSRLRERAQAEWLRHQNGKADPADATVSVRITAVSKSPPAAEPKKRSATAGSFQSRASVAANSPAPKRAGPNKALNFA